MLLNHVNNSDKHSDSSSLDNLESNNIQAPIIQNEDQLFLRRAEGHECSICQQENHHLSQTAVSTFRWNDGSRACQHVFCQQNMVEEEEEENILNDSDSWSILQSHVAKCCFHYFIFQLTQVYVQL